MAIDLPEASYAVQQGNSCYMHAEQHTSSLTGLEVLAGSTAHVSRHLKMLQLRAELPKSTVISRLVLGRSTPVEAVAPDEVPVDAAALLLLLSPKLPVPIPKDPSAAEHPRINIEGASKRSQGLNALQL